MAGSPTWFGWLSGLFTGRHAFSPAPGSHDAILEQYRVGALLNKELTKPDGHRDEELVHTLRVEYRRRQLENAQVQAASFARSAACFERPVARECCAAAGWVRQRVAASEWAVHDYHCQHIQQIKEELAAAEARRPALIVAQPGLRLDLPAALQQPPPRLDMCSVCAGRFEKAELSEHARRMHAVVLQEHFQNRGMQAAPAAAARDGAAGAAATAAAAAANLPVKEAQQGGWQQCSGGSCVRGTEGAPDTPRQPPLPPQLQHHTSSGPDQWQAWDAADEQRPMLSSKTRP